MEAVSIGTAELFRGDCMEALREMPDKAFSLAICDPPYGINLNHLGGRGGNTGWKNHERKKWDKKRPPARYWKELFRVSENQIVWGGNYFSKYLPASMGWVVWDKMQHNFTTSDAELAYTSFGCKLRVFERFRGADKGFLNKEGGDINPAQKPVALYKWLLQNYAKEGDTILDTHAGSMSSVIACLDMGFHITAYERDEDYFREAVERVRRSQDQLKLAL